MFESCLSILVDLEAADAFRDVQVVDAILDRLANFSDIMWAIRGLVPPSSVPGADSGTDQNRKFANAYGACSMLMVCLHIRERQ